MFIPQNTSRFPSRALPQWIFPTGKSLSTNEDSQGLKSGGATSASSSWKRPAPEIQVWTLNGRRLEGCNLNCKYDDDDDDDYDDDGDDGDDDDGDDLFWTVIM